MVQEIGEGQVEKFGLHLENMMGSFKDFRKELTDRIRFV